MNGAPIILNRLFFIEINFKNPNEKFHGLVFNLNVTFSKEYSVPKYAVKIFHTIRASSQLIRNKWQYN